MPQKVYTFCVCSRIRGLAYCGFLYRSEVSSHLVSPVPPPFPPFGMGGIERIFRRSECDFVQRPLNVLSRCTRAIHVDLFLRHYHLSVQARRVCEVRCSIARRTLKEQPYDLAHILLSFLVMGVIEPARRRHENVAFKERL